jgi:hypothetical protein
MITTTGVRTRRWAISSDACATNLAGPSAMTMSLQRHARYGGAPLDGGGPFEPGGDDADGFRLCQIAAGEHPGHPSIGCFDWSAWMLIVGAPASDDNAAIQSGFVGVDDHRSQAYAAGLGRTGQRSRAGARTSETGRNRGSIASKGPLPS